MPTCIIKCSRQFRELSAQEPLDNNLIRQGVRKSQNLPGRCAPLLELPRKDKEFISSLTAILLSRDSLLMVFSKTLTCLLLGTLDLGLQLRLLFKWTPSQTFLHLPQYNIMVVKSRLLSYLRRRISFRRIQCYGTQQAYTQHQYFHVPPFTQVLSLDESESFRSN